jgi:hypothetical protein
MLKTNTLAERTMGTICLGPSANFQGSYKFLSLAMGQNIRRKQFTELPMPNTVIKLVEAFASKEKQGNEITFYDRINNPIVNC